MSNTIQVGPGGIPIESNPDPNVVIEWNNVASDAIRDTAIGPTVAARALAIVQTAIFDAWATYDPVAVGTQLGDSVQRPEWENTQENKEKAISYAAFRALTTLFPTDTARFEPLMTQLGYDPADTSTDITTAAGIGNVAAKEVLEARQYDGSNQLGDLHPGAYSDYTNYQPANTPYSFIYPDRWQPQLISNGEGGIVAQQFLTPQWGLVKPFALESGDRFRPVVGPITIESDPDGYKQQAKDVYEISQNLTDKQKTIAEFWAQLPGSETPIGTWNRFGEAISNRDNHDLDDDAKMFFVLNNALFDATISAWDTKRAYDSERPVSVIRSLYDSDWTPYLSTPPWPEYVSGHSTFSAAAAEVLKRFTGSDTFNASYTQLAGVPGLPDKLGHDTDVTLHWDTFSDAADEAGISRRYGGIHFADGDVVGRQIGRYVGGVVWNKAMSYIDPESTLAEQTDPLTGHLLIGDDQNTLVGSEGSDRFRLTRDETNTIVHFTQGQDWIELDNIPFERLTISQGTGMYQNDTLIQLNTGDSNKLLGILTGVQSSAIAPADFVTAHVTSLF
ncbi:DUF6851 domain-containing protein [Tolypothrix bouteillei VB521301_2]|uniref:vanadium-dependent haloperoxidase n=1 Tax=Tolypothrix bouteillei TaxID=1246981 RepID=UPI000679E4D3